MYRDFNHLRELCKYYLENEKERLALVTSCNRLMSSGFSFDDRVSDVAALGGVTLPPIQKNVDGQSVKYVNPNKFQKFGWLIVKHFFRSLFMKTLHWSWGLVGESTRMRVRTFILNHSAN